MPSQTRDVKDIFCEAREITSPQELTAFLDQACGGDAQVRQQVEALLQAERQAGRFLGVFDSETTLPLETTLGEGPGTVIGRYKLLQELGHGGFGVVFMAEQQEPYRRVALKILKPGMDTKEIIARFAAEEQALALMEHPNIARVFDSGATASGRPYFVMELVQGVPITEYCDLNNLTPDERLQLFIDVCRAVQHAHQKGVIHRDLKPGNILVAVRDGVAVVKVIDFGIAKAVSQRLTNHTLVTGPNAILGTPLYMSPEQAGIKPLDVDTRTDIYSLGVVLYELLTGATPFDRKRLSGASPDEVCRIIREEEPPKPSTKIGTLGDTATTVAQHRKMEPRRLSTLIKGDLDWIVMKAMEKDRTRRYDTAKDLAEDVQRYLDHKPVEASPPSPLYRLRKFVRRNRRAGMMATAAAVMVLLGTVAMSAIVQRYDAERTAERQKELDAKIIPQIERYKTDEKYSAAVQLAEPWRHDFPEHPRLAELWHAVTVNWTVITNEPGARVSRKAYGVKDAKWEDLGLTPLDRLPVARGFFHWKIEKDGFDAVEGCAGPEEVEIRRDLMPAGVTPSGMVRVTFQGPDGREGYFFIDRCEVTNREFKEFLDAGGYQRSELWRVPIMQDGKAIALDDAIKTFVDSTGRPGPAGWTNGTFPAGEENLPVRGISWYEAAAYAQFRSKALPTIEQWTAAASVDLVTYIAPHSNMNSDGPAPVGSYQAPSQFGVYDVAGNVKEWCLNATTRGRRVVCGGAWEDPTYLFDGNEFVDPLTRWPSLGLRCLRDVRSGTKEPPTIVNEGSGVIEVPPAPSPEQLVQYKAVFRYNKQAKFNQTVVLDSSAATSYAHKIVEIDAAYASERLTLHIFLPKGHDAPYQTIVYFPGSGSQKADVFSLDHTDVSRAAAFVATGRAVCYPVYKGTFERRVSNTLGPEQGNELRVAQVKDLCRALDYLETRLDVFDMSRLVYVGFSWGAALGPLMMGIEDRFSVCVLVSGGLWRGANYPELEPKTYVRLLDKPVLMINGAADWKYFSLANRNARSSMPSPAEDKQHHIFPSAGHGVPLDEAQALIDTWLNEHFGPVGPPLPPIERADQLALRATALIASKRYSQAEQLLKEALKVYEGDLGKDHPNTLRTAASLADAMLNQKRFHEARQLLEATLKSQWAALGKNHEDTLETRKIIATVYVSLAGEKCWTQGKSLDEYREALRFAQLSLQAYDLQINQRLYLALAQYRSGEWDASAQTLKDVVKLESGARQCVVT
jgi:serine/threonine protein kinase/dienelactone hydrolase